MADSRIVEPVFQFSRLLDEGEFGSLSYVLHFLSLYELSLYSFASPFLRPYARTAYTLREFASLSELSEMTLRWQRRLFLSSFRPSPLGTIRQWIQDDVERHVAFVLYLRSTFSLHRTVLIPHNVGTTIAPIFSEVFHPPDFDNSSWIRLSSLLFYSVTSFRGFPPSAPTCVGGTVTRQANDYLITSQDRFTFASRVLNPVTTRLLMTIEEEISYSQTLEVGLRIIREQEVEEEEEEEEYQCCSLPAQWKTWFLSSSIESILEKFDDDPDYVRTLLFLHSRNALCAVSYRSETELIDELWRRGVRFACVLCPVMLDLSLRSTFETILRGRNRFERRRTVLRSSAYRREASVIPSLLSMCYFALKYEKSLLMQHCDFPTILTNVVALSIVRNMRNEERFRLIMEEWNSMLIPFVFGEKKKRTALDDSVLRCYDDGIEFVVVVGFRNSSSSRFWNEFLCFSFHPERIQVDGEEEEEEGEREGSLCWNVTPSTTRAERPWFSSTPDPTPVFFVSDILNKLWYRRTFSTDGRARWVSPLHVACWEGSVDEVNLLLSRGADVNTCSSGFHVIRPLHLAVWARQWGVFDLLVQKWGAEMGRNHRRICDCRFKQ